MITLVKRERAVGEMLERVDDLPDHHCCEDKNEDCLRKMSVRLVCFPACLLRQ